MNKQIKFVVYGIILYPVYLISKLIPTSNHIWVFGAWYGKLYTDNTSYLYEYIKEKKPEIKAVWLTRNKQAIHDLREQGYLIYHKNSIKGFWHGCRAGATFINCGYDDVNKYCINQSYIVQLWHGIPLKKIKNDDIINENIQRPAIITVIRNIIFKFLPFFFYLPLEFFKSLLIFQFIFFIRCCY